MIAHKHPIITGATADSVSIAKGRVLTDQALAVPATPAGAVDGPSGFDPSRIAKRLTPPQLRALFALTANYRNTVTDRRGGRPNHNACGGLEARGLAELSSGDVPRARLTPLGLAVKALATEARRAETENTGSVHEGAGPKDIAQ